MFRLASGGAGVLLLAIMAAIAAAAVSPLGDVALLAGEEGGLELWETTGRTLAARFDLQAERPESALVTSIAFSPDGRTAATVGVDKILRIWTIGREAAVAVIPTPDAVPLNANARSPDAVPLLPSATDSSPLAVVARFAANE